MTIEQASTWMDEVRNETQYRNTSPWHYVDFPPGANYHPTDEPNIVNALTHAISALQRSNTLPADSIKFYLLVVIHLTGDIHQPMHVGYPTDKGGNDYQINYNGKGTNLHRIWDSEIIESQDITLDDCLSQAKQISPDGLRGFNQVNPVQWIEETRSLTQSCYPPAK
jgi:hypothetical protein